METQRASISVAETSDGAKVTIEYEDGHVVRMNVGPDSLVLRLHLGLGDEGGGGE